MPNVFISYASEQQAVAQQLEAELAAKGVNAWRDKTRLHAGERWPKALGDAIADSEALILLWSAEAEQSDFVELEWNIAVAMNKPVMPCLLDENSLPHTLEGLAPGFRQRYIKSSRPNPNRRSGTATVPGYRPTNPTPRHTHDSPGHQPKAGAPSNQGHHQSTELVGWGQCLSGARRHSHQVGSR